MPNTRRTAPKTKAAKGSRVEQLSLSPVQIEKLLKEGMALRRAFAQRIAPMKMVSPDDLKTRMR